MFRLLREDSVQRCLDGTDGIQGAEAQHHAVGACQLQTAADAVFHFAAALGLGAHAPQIAGKVVGL